MQVIVILPDAELHENGEYYKSFLKRHRKKREI